MTRIERTGGWLIRWRVVYVNEDGGMDLETLHFSRMGARFAAIMDGA